GVPRDLGRNSSSEAFAVEFIHDVVKYSSEVEEKVADTTGPLDLIKRVEVPGVEGVLQAVSVGLRRDLVPIGLSSDLRVLGFEVTEVEPGAVPLRPRTQRAPVRH